jgi:hypothetical protein
MYSQAEENHETLQRRLKGKVIPVQAVEALRVARS